jgi:hypothetical protein
MAKQIVTITRLKVKGDLLPPASVVDVKKYELTQDQLIRLHKSGAIKVVDTSEPVDRPELTPVDVVVEGNNGESGTGGSSGVAGADQVNPDKP